MDLIAEPDAARAALRSRFDGAVCVSAEKGEVAELVEVLREKGNGKREK